MRSFRWLVGARGALLGVVLGCAAGLGAFTLDYAEGASYFSTDPAACANCHVMVPYHDSWLRSSHHAVAGCIDCHLPHDFLPKYVAKADNGFRHSWAFTFDDFDEPIRIIARNARILQANCIACHEDLVHGLLLAGEREEPACVRCHDDVGHGR